jgi:hypothetical protein
MSTIYCANRPHVLASGSLYLGPHVLDNLVKSTVYLGFLSISDHIKSKLHDCFVNSAIFDNKLFIWDLN